MRFALIAVMLLAGCASTYKKPDATDAEFGRDSTDCDVKLAQTNIVGAIQRRNFMDRCMAGKGWTAE